MKKYISFLTFVITLFFALSASAQNKPTIQPAKAVGIGVWADGFKHVVQGNDVGRGCLEVSNFQVVNGKALYACLTLEDRRYHVIHDTEMKSDGFSRIADLTLDRYHNISYTGYEGQNICTVTYDESRCQRNVQVPVFGDDGRSVVLGSARPSLVISTTPPTLPLSLTGGKTITEFWMVNNQPLWVDCDSEVQGFDGTNCRMRWNGHAQGKSYHQISQVVVDGNQVAYKVQLAEAGDCKVIWGRTEGEAFQDVYELQILNAQPLYVAEHANSLTYVVKGRQKEAFRSVSDFRVVQGKIFFIGQKDPAATPSPI